MSVPVHLCSDCDGAGQDQPEVAVPIRKGDLLRDLSPNTESQERRYLHSPIPRIQERREECDVSRVPGETNLRDVEGYRAGRGANNGVTILDHNSLLCRRDEAMARTPWSSFVSARSWEHIVLYTRRVIEQTVRTPWSSFVSHVAVSTPGRRQVGPLLKLGKQARHSTPSKNSSNRFWSVEDASE